MWGDNDIEMRQTFMKKWREPQRLGVRRGPITDRCVCPPRDDDAFPAGGQANAPPLQICVRRRARIGGCHDAKDCLSPWLYLWPRGRSETPDPQSGHPTELAERISMRSYRCADRSVRRRSDCFRLSIPRIGRCRYGEPSPSAVDHMKCYASLRLEIYVIASFRPEAAHLI